MTTPEDRVLLRRYHLRWLGPVVTGFDEDLNKAMVNAVRETVADATGKVAGADVRAKDFLAQLQHVHRPAVEAVGAFVQEAGQEGLQAGDVAVAAASPVIVLLNYSSRSDLLNVWTIVRPNSPAARNNASHSRAR